MISSSRSQARLVGSKRARSQILKLTKATREAMRDDDLDGAKSLGLTWHFCGTGHQEEFTGAPGGVL